MKLTKNTIGKYKNQNIIEYTLENENGLLISVLNLNGIWNKFSFNSFNFLNEVNINSIPNKNKKIVEIVESDDALKIISDEFEISYLINDENVLIFESSGTSLMVGYQDADSIDSSSFNTLIRFADLKLRLQSDDASIEVISAKPLIIETKTKDNKPYSIRYRVK